MTAEPILKEKLSSSVLNVLLGVAVLIGGVCTFLLLTQTHEGNYTVQNESQTVDTLVVEEKRETVLDSNSVETKKYYVIAGVFLQYDNALAYSNKLNNLNITNEILEGETSGQKCYRVSIAESGSLEDVILKRESMSDPRLKDLWVLKPE